MVRPLSCASSATTRFDGSCNFLSKSYENRGNPAQAIIVNGVDADYTHAVGLPSSESRSFARGGACPTQWLPIFLAAHVATPSPSPSPSPSGCTDLDGTATDRYDVSCSRYTANPDWCGGYWDDNDFSSGTMCCVCGGGATQAIYISPPPLPPSQPTTAFDFGEGLGPEGLGLGWSNGGGNPPYALNFTKAEGTTPSSDTGPSAGVEGAGSYLYAEVSGRSEGDLFKLAYDGSACSGIGQVSTVAFYYHMYGARVGELRVTNAAGEAVWSLSSDQGNAWQAVSVGVFSASFVFEYTCGDGYTGDAALAQVAVSCGAAPPLLPYPPPAPPLHPPVVVEDADIGQCVFDPSTSCLCSSNFAAAGACAATSTTDGQYGNSESCLVEFGQPVLLQAYLFDTEPGYDWLIVDPPPAALQNGEETCENKGFDPSACTAVGCCVYDDGQCWSAVGTAPCISSGSGTWGTAYSGTEGPDGVAATRLSWTSDGSVASGGFIVCFTLTPPPSPPSPPLPPRPPSPPPSPPSPPPLSKPPSPPPSPPSLPLQPGSRYALSSRDLITALNDNTVSRIVLVAGTYEFANRMCSDQGGSALCINRHVTIEAEVAGSVVLDAMGTRRAIYVSSDGRAELVGLHITGGAADNVSFLTKLNPWTRVNPSPARSSHFVFQGGGIWIDGSAEINECNIHDNVATGGTADDNVAYCNFKSNPLRVYLVSYDPVLRWNVTCVRGWQYGGGLLIVGTATLTNTDVYDNRADKVLLGIFFHTLPRRNVTCAHGWQSGGGLFIYGTATLTNTSVYSNQAGDVSSPFELFMISHPFPCARTLRVLMVCRRAGDSISWALLQQWAWGADRCGGTLWARQRWRTSTCTIIRLTMCA